MRTNDAINRQAMVDFFLDKGMITAAIYAEHFPAIQTAQHYCRDCNFSRCYINVDKQGKTETYWWCMNWKNGTKEGGYCHEWKRRSDG